MIISCAVTGAVHTPSKTPHLPITSDQIASGAIAAADAGASILNLHAPDPETGQPDQSVEGFAEFLPRIKLASGARL